MNHEQVTIFTDGSSRGNPGPGGWGVIYIENQNGKGKSDARVTELGGREERTTNNRMEMTAAIKALKVSPKGVDIVLCTDSAYLINGVTKWVKAWKKNGWKTRDKKNVLNRDLWMELDSLSDARNVKWRHVGGHMGVAGNERCDEIATAFADGERTVLFSGFLADYHVKDIADKLG